MAAASGHPPHLVDFSYGKIRREQRAPPPSFASVGNFFDNALQIPPAFATLNPMTFKRLGGGAQPPQSQGNYVIRGTGGNGAGNAGFARQGSSGANAGNSNSPPSTSSSPSGSPSVLVGGVIIGRSSTGAQRRAASSGDGSRPPPQNFNGGKNEIRSEVVEAPFAYDEKAIVEGSKQQAGRNTAASGGKTSASSYINPAAGNHSAPVRHEVLAWAPQPQPQQQQQQQHASRATRASSSNNFYDRESSAHGREQGSFHPEHRQQSFHQQQPPSEVGMGYNLAQRDIDRQTRQSVQQEGAPVSHPYSNPMGENESDAARMIGDSRRRRALFNDTTIADSGGPIG